MTTQEQHTFDWYRDRLGRITGSCVGEIVGRGKGAAFSKSGYTYLNTVASERLIPAYITDDDELFRQYLDETSVSSKSMRIGTLREDEARQLYQDLTCYPVSEVGCIPHPDIDGFASSPDGVIYLDGEHPVGVLEIKCPKPNTFVEYLTQVKTPSDLRKYNNKYFWQCLAHLAVTGAKWCDFVVYCPYIETPIHKIRITPEEADMRTLIARVKEALQYIDSVTGKAAV